jgi:hypothetical protein
MAAESIFKSVTAGIMTLPMALTFAFTAIPAATAAPGNGNGCVDQPGLCPPEGPGLGIPVEAGDSGDSKGASAASKKGPLCPEVPGACTD